MLKNALTRAAFTPVRVLLDTLYAHTPFGKFVDDFNATVDIMGHEWQYLYRAPADRATMRDAYGKGN